MKILILVSSLTAGGEQRVASLWTKGFTEYGHDVIMVLGCSRKQPRTYEVPSQTKIYHVNNFIAHHLYKRLGIDFFYTKRLRRIIKQSQPDIIISLYHPWTEWADEVTKGTGIPIISTEHISFERPTSAKKMSSNNIHRRYELNKNYAAMTVLTTADKECLKGYIDNVNVLPNPLAYTPANVIPPKTNIILAVGQLHSWQCKGLDLLIKAWGKEAINFPEWKLQIAGGDRNNSQSYLQSIADSFQLGKQIEFLGFQRNMLPIYQRASVFVLSSRYEGFGMALTEAMSQGCACIACDYKGRQKEIMPQDNQGILCPIDDIEALADAIHKMLSDKEFRKTIQLNGIERSKHYQLGNIMEYWKEIFNKINITL